MKNIFFVIVASIILVCLNLSCTSVESQNEVNRHSTANFSESNSNTKNPFDSKNDLNLLCNELSKLQNIPYEQEEIGTDAIYDGLREEGKNAIPCLVEKISDTTSMNDPRDGDPHVMNFKVGDAAVFMLIIISKEHPENMLPPEYAKSWKTEGIYTYFNYVEKPENREKIQLWWKNWMKKNLK